MSKSKFWAGDSDESGSDDSPKKKVIAKNRFQMMASDSDSDSDSDSGSSWDSDSSSGSSSSGSST